MDFQQVLATIQGHAQRNEILWPESVLTKQEASVVICEHAAAIARNTISQNSQHVADLEYKRTLLNLAAICVQALKECK